MKNILQLQDIMKDNIAPHNCKLTTNCMEINASAIVIMIVVVWLETELLVASLKPALRISLLCA